MSSLLGAIRDFLKDSLDGDPAADPPLPGRLNDLDGIKNQLSNINVGIGNNGLTDWLDVLDNALNDEELRDTIIIRALQVRAPRIAEALVLAGLVVHRFEDAAPRAAAFRFDWDHLDAFLQSPGDTVLATLLGRIQELSDIKIVQVLTALLLFSPKELLKLEYAQQGYAALPDPRPDGAVDLIALVEELVNSPIRIGVPIEPPLTLEALKAAAAVAPVSDHLAILGPDVLGANRLDGYGIELRVDDPRTFSAGSMHLTDRIRVTASAPDSGGQTYRLVMKAGTFDPDLASTGVFEVAVQFDPAGDRAIVGPPGKTRLEVGPARLQLRLQPKGGPLYTARAVVERVGLVFSTEPLGFLSSIARLPKEVRFETDVALSYVQGSGLQSEGGGVGLPPLATEFTMPLNLRAGSSGAEVSVERTLVRIEAKRAGGSLRSRVMLRFGAKAGFGPVKIVADGMGAWFGHWDDGSGGILGPTGIGLSLEAGPVSGGGFLARLNDTDYAGGLDLKVIGIGVGAFALFGRAGSAPAFVGILGIRLPPPGVQIGFGFAVSGVGGVIGINRRADTDVIREQLASGTSGQILFCDNPTGNALTVIGQLPRMFPAAEGVFLIGPTLRIDWLGLIKLDAGIFIELPGPRQIFVAGSARLVIGSEQAALVSLRMDFIGGIDLTKSLIYFDAALVNSSVMQVFKITGGIALRIAYGANGYFLFSVGGFHPSFNPGGLELPRLARAGTSASVGVAWFKLENYFAVTSNTFQVGASFEAGLELGPLSAHGWIRFDALVQFDPFYFVAAIDAGFDVEVFGESLCGVRLQGKLSGPGPLVIEARASVKVLFVRVSESVTITLGSGGGNQPTGITDLLDRLMPEFLKAENIRGDGEDRSVLMRPDAPRHVGGTTVVGAIGAVVWEQKRVPLGLDLQRFEGAPLAPAAAGAHHLTLTPADASAEVETDWFGVGTYLTLAESEALNNARFTEAQSGVRISLADQALGRSRDRNIEIRLVKLPEPIPFNGLFPTAAYMSPALAGMQGERGGTARVVAGGAKITASQELWTAHAPGGETLAEGLSATQAFLESRGKGFSRPAGERVLTDVELI